MKLKNKNNKHKKIIVIIFFILIFTFISLYFYDKKVSNVLIKYAKIESKKVGIDIISKGVSDEIVKVLDRNDIFSVDKDNNGNIELIHYNTKVVNEILSVTSKVVMNNFKEIEEKNEGIVSYIPMGIVTNNLFIENLGPKVPVKLSPVGNVLTSLKTDVKNYGVNSALVQISVRIEANVDILIPLKTGEIKIVNEVPVSIKIIEGNVSSFLSSYN